MWVFESFQGRAKIIKTGPTLTYPIRTTDLNMDPAHAEIEELVGLKEEMIATVAKVCPRLPRPVEVSLVETEPVDPLHWPHPIRFAASFKLTYEGHRGLVIKFPLRSRMHQDIIADEVKSEASAMVWARSHSNLPVPKVRYFDPKGNAALSTLGRPFILHDHMPGKHITNADWERMSKEHRLLVIARVAMITTVLSLHSFDKIGSLHPRDQQMNVVVGPLSTSPLARYRLQHQARPKVSQIFQPQNSPYSTATEYMIDIANMHLVHRAINSLSTPSRDYVEMWMYRSLIPGLTLGDFNRGPFVLVHGYLDRTALLFNEDYDLTGIVNWEWSQTEPLQIAALPPPFLLNLPIPLEGHESVFLRTHYANALDNYEKEFRRSPGEKYTVPPILSHLAREGHLLANAGLVAKQTADDLSDLLWRFIIVPTFGSVDRKILLELFTNAPGLWTEHRRTAEFVHALQANTLS